MTVYINESQTSDTPGYCVYTAYLEGRCDSIEMSFNDDDRAIRSLGIRKGDTVQALEGNIDTGVMYVSDIEYSGEQVAIRALSLPLSAFRTNTRRWSDVSMVELINDVLSGLGLKISYDDKPAFTYDEAAMLEDEPFRFLSGKLSLEGYGIRVLDGVAHIFNERSVDRSEYDYQVEEADFAESPMYSTSDSGLVSRVENTYEAADGRLISTVRESGIEGKILRLHMSVGSAGEAIRFSDGIMRAANKYEYVTEGVMDGLDHAPGEILYLVDAPAGHGGENVVYSVKSDLAEGRQTLFLRRALEGY